METKGKEGNCPDPAKDRDVSRLEVIQEDREQIILQSIMRAMELQRMADVQRIMEL